MRPLSFDIDTAKEVVGDARMRTIESKARQDADNRKMDAPEVEGQSYWERVTAGMEYVVYAEAFNKRMARIQRMKERNK
jgi:hypothetical protein